MKINANSLRVGNVIEYQNGLWVLLKREHVKPGKGGAYIQAELKHITHGTKTNVRFISSEDVEKAHMEIKKFQYQYMDGNDLVVMDMQNFEQLNFSKELLGDALPFLQDEMEVNVEFCNDKPITISLPEMVTLEVVSADAVVKNQTASSSYKPAMLENGVKVMVPSFIESGDKIIVKTEDGTYFERAKK
jgi:elongation factor P